MSRSSVWRIACFGGIYSNHLALAQALRDAKARGAQALFCLGDLGAFGPHPDRVFPWLHQYEVQCLRGNYDDSLARGLDDCQCGYTDPRDNYFARISYRYTYQHTSPENRRWLGTLPEHIRLEVQGLRVLMCHGSPRRMNEFLWESTTSTQFLQYLLRRWQCDVILATHTGIKWKRRLGPRQWFVNVGVLGRPENDGRTNVWYTLLDFFSDGTMKPQFVPVFYDHHRLAQEMRQEKLPEEFVQTILTGWWTTCLEVLPQKERRRGKY